jgi:gluconokinase
MSSELFLGLDIGTSGIKAIVIDGRGNQVNLYSREYPMICTEPGMAEIDPEQILTAFIQVARDSVAEPGSKGHYIEAVGLSTQLFSFLAVDIDGKPLTNLITWADNRSINQAEDIKEHFDYRKMYDSTGCRTRHPMYPVSKILWLKETQPELYQKAHKFITIKEYILWKLFGEYVIDITDASTTGCFNIHSFQWDDYILRHVLELDIAKFGEPVDCLHILKKMKPEYAAAMGVHPLTPVITGSGDGMLANLVCGVIDNTSMSCTIGTSGALRVTAPKPLLDPEQRTWCYCFTRDLWVAGGAINNGGIVLKWLRDNFREQFQYDLEQEKLDNVYQLLDKFAAEIRPGSDGLLFLPFLTGERSPNWNAHAKGLIYGFQLVHGRKHLVRAAMEGVMYRMFSVYQVLTALNGEVRQLKASGGYANSDVWLQIQADVFDKEIIITKVREASAFGAACLAMTVIRGDGDLSKSLPKMEGAGVVRPNPENVEIYRDGYRKFVELYGKVMG